MAISSIGGIAIGNVRKLDTAGLATRQATEQEKAEMERIWKEQFRVPTGKADNDPSYVYAKVKVGGKVVATIYNSGGAATPNAIYGKVKNLFSMGEKETLTGPALAQKRAEEIAEALGGTVEKLATDESLAAWENRPPMTWSYDYKSMEAAKLRDAAAKTKYDAQAIAQKTEEANEKLHADFWEFAKKTPTERLRAQILGEKDLTEEELAAMSPEERKAIEEEIANIIKEKIKEGAKQAAANPEMASQMITQGQQAAADGSVQLELSKQQEGFEKDKKAASTPEIESKQAERARFQELLITAFAA